GRHDGQVRHLLAGGNGRGGFLGEHHRLDGEDIHPALGEGGCLLLEGGEVLFIGRHVVAHAVVEGEAARRADGARNVALGRAHGAGELRALYVELARAVSDLVLVELEPRPTEGVGLHEVRAGPEIALVDTLHHVGMRVVPELRAGAVEQARVEEGGAVAAVEDAPLARLRPLHNLPAAGTRHQAATVTPRSSLARTTASVESRA